MYNIIFLGRGIYLYDYIILVGGFNHLEKKHEKLKVNGKDDIPYMKWKITAMFETTNQNNIPLSQVPVGRPPPPLQPCWLPAAGCWEIPWEIHRWMLNRGDIDEVTYHMGDKLVKHGKTIKWGICFKKKHKLVQFLGDGLWQWVKISSPWNVRSFCLGFPKFA
jgi:hypothetical protein